MSMVAQMFCCPDVARSDPSPPPSAGSGSLSLPGKLPAVVGTSQLLVSQPKDLDTGLGVPSWEPSAGEMLCSLSREASSWLPVMGFVLTPPEGVLSAEFSLDRSARS